MSCESKVTALHFNYHTRWNELIVMISNQAQTNPIFVLKQETNFPADIEWSFNAKKNMMLKFFLVLCVAVLKGI